MPCRLHVVLSDTGILNGSRYMAPLIVVCIAIKNICCIFEHMVVVMMG